MHTVGSDTLWPGSQGVDPQTALEPPGGGLRASLIFFVVNESGFSEKLDKFIAAEINSLEQLEILLLLSDNPKQWWTVRNVYEIIKSSHQSVQHRLNEMTESGILVKEGDGEARYQFGLTEGPNLESIHELREAYKERPVKVVQAIYSKPPDAVKEFAKAFRLRKDK